MMEKNEEKKERLSAKEDADKLEKVVYKIVHVPYFYPVPVDIDWYFKHQKHITYPHENGLSRSSPDPQFDHVTSLPPSNVPFPIRRDYRDYQGFRRHRRESEAEYFCDTSSPSVSPSYARTSPMYDESTRNSSRTNSPTANDNDERNRQKEKENAVDKDNRIESSASTESNKKILENAAKKTELDEVMKNGKNEDLKTVKREEQDEDEESLNDSESCSESVEVNRKRKRFLMNFRYDHRKKDTFGNESMDKTNNKSTGNDDTFDSPRYGMNDDKEKYRKRVMVPTDHDNMMTSHVPYVMVPMRSAKYMTPEMRYEPRYQSSKNYQVPYEPRSYDRTNGHNENRGLRHNERKSIDKDDRKQELRFHPNGRRARTVFSRQQLLTLNNVFEKHPFVSGERMSELSDQLGLDRKIVKIWFQNKRQYARKKGGLVEKDEEFYYDYPGERYIGAPPPTMAERWQN